MEREINSAVVIKNMNQNSVCTLIVEQWLGISPSPSINISPLNLWGEGTHPPRPHNISPLKLWDEGPHPPRPH